MADMETEDSKNWAKLKAMKNAGEDKRIRVSVWHRPVLELFLKCLHVTCAEPTHPCGGNLTPTWRLWYLFRDCWFGFAWSLAVLRPILGLRKTWAPQYSSISAYQLVYPAWLSLSFKSDICWVPFPEWSLCPSPTWSWQDLCSVNRIVPSNEPIRKK